MREAFSGDELAFEAKVPAAQASATHYLLKEGSSHGALFSLNEQRSRGDALG